VVCSRSFPCWHHLSEISAVGSRFRARRVLEMPSLSFGKTPFPGAESAVFFSIAWTALCLLFLLPFFFSFFVAKVVYAGPFPFCSRFHPLEWWLVISGKTVVRREFSSVVSRVWYRRPILLLHFVPWSSISLMRFFCTVWRI